MERTVGTAMNGVSFGPYSFSDLDFADDVALLLSIQINFRKTMEFLALMEVWEQLSSCRSNSCRWQAAAMRKMLHAIVVLTG